MTLHVHRKQYCCKKNCLLLEHISLQNMTTIHEFHKKFHVTPQYLVGDLIHILKNIPPWFFAESKLNFQVSKGFQI